MKVLSNIFAKKKVRGFEVLDTHMSYFQSGDILRPARQTFNSAGYDICAIGDYVIEPNMKAIISTGLTAYMPSNEWLALYIRSGLSYKHDLTLSNATGVIDSDFYGKQIQIMLRNESQTAYIINHGDRIAQGIFMSYLTTDDDALTLKQPRTAGFGSTGVKAA